MNLKKKIDPGKLLIFPTIILGLTLLALGGWWLYLISHGIPKDLDIKSLIKWEGLTFITVLFLLLLSMFYLYWLDQRKTQALRDFFASMTHELKTPLAGVRLLAEVIFENVQESRHDKLPQLSTRLIDETFRLEIQMDKILQLSRLERGGNLNLTALNLKDFIEQVSAPWDKKLQIKLKSTENDVYILADEFALNLIFRNLFENTLLHSHGKDVSLKIHTDNHKFIKLNYRDCGTFHGDPEKLGELFYKFNSSKGSGIGVYLIKKIMQQMGGRLIIKTTPQLEFDLLFKLSQNNQRGIH